MEDIASPRESSPSFVAHAPAEPRSRNAALVERLRQLVRQTQPPIRPFIPGCYKSFPVESDSYFWNFSRYIHLNPCRGKRPPAKSLEEVIETVASLHEVDPGEYIGLRSRAAFGEFDSTRQAS